MTNYYMLVNSFEYILYGCAGGFKGTTGGALAEFMLADVDYR